MTREQIDARIEFIEKKLSEARHVEDIKSLSRTLERLIMMDADDED